MTMMQAVRRCFERYVTVSGRARRAEFWWFTLFNVVVGFVLGVLDGLIFGYRGPVAQPLSTLYSLAVLLPSLAVAVRRLHDTGRSGWWLLLFLVPLIGALVLLFFYATAGERGANAYGPDPKGSGGHDRGNDGGARHVEDMTGPEVRATSVPKAGR